MKIKLVTFAPHPNFGTCLQAYALNAVLVKMGYDVEFIYNDRFSILQKLGHFINRLAQIVGLKRVHVNGVTGRTDIQQLELPNSPLKSFLAKYLGLNKLEIIHKKRHSLQWKKVVKFAWMDGNFKMRHLYSKADYESVVRDADIFITGSDQIWNPYCAGYDPMMFLEFVKGRKKSISYSSSISLPEIPNEVKDRIRNNLSFFQHIAVREQRSVELLNNLLGRRDVKLVVDPTYLLSIQEWENFSSKAQIEFNLPEKYIFCYCIGSKRQNSYNSALQEVKNLTGITEVINLECYNRDFSNWGDGLLYKDAGPYEWVYLLQHASYICMDSFHATVFALKFKKDFVHVLKNCSDEIGSQNSRMYDMLHRYGLDYKIYEEGKNDWQKPIDYNRVTPLINAEIDDSLNYLAFELSH